MNDAIAEKRFQKLRDVDMVDQWGPTDAKADALRRHVAFKILEPLGLDSCPVVKDTQTWHGKKTLLEHAVWPGGPKMGDLVGDAMPFLPPTTKYDDNRHVVWDLHFTNYNPNFWAGLLKPREGQTLFRSVDGSGVVPGPGGSQASSSTSREAKQPYSGVLLGSGACRNPYIGHECDTGSFWLQYHGTNLYAGLTAVCNNYISRSESHKFDDDHANWAGDTKEWNSKFTHDPNREGFETGGAGRGIYTSQMFELSAKFACPHLHNKSLIKCVLLVAIPGDLSDQGVGVNFHSGGASGYGTYARIPKHIVCESLAAAQPRDRKQIMEGLHKFAGKIGGSPNAEIQCVSLRDQLKKGHFKRLPELEQVSNRQVMTEKSREGSEGEEPWTVMNMDGCECVSSQVHVVGFFIGYTGSMGNQPTPSRKEVVFEGWDNAMLPAVIRSIEPGSAVRRPKSQLEKMARSV